MMHGRLKLCCSVFLSVSLALGNVAPVFAQLVDTNIPPTTTTVTPPAETAPAPTPVTTPETTVSIPPVTTSTEPTTTTTTTSTTETVAPVIALVVPTDTTAPVISGVLEASLLTTDATIVWSTDELATSRLEYGTTTNYGSEATLGISAFLAHTTTILGLSANTTYHYCIHATDLAGNVTNSCGHSFTTAVAATTLDSNPPTVTLVTVAPVTSSSATVSWTTSEVANGEVEYGTTASYGSVTPLNTNLSLTHSATISGLTANTLYHYRIRSSDEIGNVATSNDNTFTTEASASSTPSVVVTLSETTTITTSTSTATSVTTPETTVSTPSSSTVSSGTSTPSGSTTVSAPSVVISGIEVGAINSTEAAIQWTTTLPSDSQVEYGITSLLGQHTTTNGTLTTAHTVLLTGLSSNTNYYFKVHSKPVGATVATVSSAHEFNTLSVATPTIPAAQITAVSGQVTSSTQASVSVTTDIVTTAHVEYGITTGYGQISDLGTASGLSHSSTLSDLTPDTDYQYRVKVTDIAGNITYSENHSFTTPALPVPSTSTTTSTTTDNSSSSTTTATSSTSTSSSTPSTTTTTPVPHLTPAPPSAITNFSVGSSDQTSATLAWEASADAAQQYDIRYSTAPITEANFNNASQDQALLVTYDELSPQGTHRTYIVAGLNPGTKYYFALKSKYQHSIYSAVSNVPFVTLPASISDVSSVGGGGRSRPNESEPAPSANAGFSSSTNTHQASTQGGGVIEAPIILNAAGVDGQIVLSWKNPHDASFVRTLVVRKEGAYPASPKDGTVIYEGNGQTFTDTSLANGKTYYYTVYSYDHAKNYSKGIHVSLAPKQNVVEVILNKNPMVVPVMAVDHFVETLKYGTTDIEVEHLQEVLASDEHLYPEKRITGFFGPLTEQALKRFQQKHQLPQTGITDKATQAKLNAVSRAVVKLSLPEELALFEHDLKYGDQGEEVEQLQTLLIYEGSFGGLEMTGVFDTSTVKAVKAFQKKYGVRPTSGNFGPKTRHKVLDISGL